MKTIKIILPIIAIIFSIIAIILSSLAISKKTDSAIQNVFEVGLGSFFSDSITNMYVSDGSNPNLQGEFYDEEVLQNVREIMLLGVFQKNPSINTIADVHSDIISFIRFSGENCEYGFVIVKNTIQINFNGVKECYNSNVGFALKRIVEEKANSLVNNV